MRIFFFSLAFELLFEQLSFHTYDIIEQRKYRRRKKILSGLRLAHIERRRQIDWRSLINEYFRLKLTLDYFSSLISCDFVYV